MKKVLSLILMVTVLMSFAACTFEKPEEKASAFFDAVKTQDNKVLRGYVDNKYVNVLVNGKGDEKVLGSIEKTLFKNMEYEFLSSEEKDGKVILKTRITNVDFSKVMKDYDGESYSYVIDNLYSGSLNRKNLNAKTLKILNKAVKEAYKEGKKYKKDIDVVLVENDHHAYDLQVTDKLMDALSGGFITGMNK